MATGIDDALTFADSNSSRAGVRERPRRLPFDHETTRDPCPDLPHLIGLGAAGAVASGATKLHVLSRVCVTTKSRAVAAPTKGHCPTGSLLEAVGTTKVGKTGATGATGPAGLAGATGAQGPQGPAGAPATSKVYLVNVEGGKATNATAGVTQVGPAVNNNTTDEQATRWTFPVNIDQCAIQVSVVSTGGYYAVYVGGGVVGSGPAVQATRIGTTDVYVRSVWPGGAGVDFSLLVTWPLVAKSTVTARVRRRPGSRRG